MVVASPATAGVPASNVAILVVLVGVLFLLLLLLGGVGEVDLGVDGDLVAEFVVRLDVRLVARLAVGLVAVSRGCRLRMNGDRGSVAGGSRLSVLGGAGLESRLGGLARLARLVGGLAGSAVLLALGKVAASGSGRGLFFWVLEGGILLFLCGVLFKVLLRRVLGRILRRIWNVDFGVEFDVVRGAVRLVGLSGLVWLNGLTGLSGLAGVGRLASLSRLARMSRLTRISRLGMVVGLTRMSQLVGLRMSRLAWMNG